MSKKESGPAFPSTISNSGENPVLGFCGEQIMPNNFSAYPGMSLRDYFAAKAMQSFISNEAIIQRHNESAAFNYIDPDVLMATSACIVADAMLRERAK